MNKTAAILLSAIALAGCGIRNKDNGSYSEDMVENGRIGYADIVSFIVQGYQCGWDGMSPEEIGLSPVYSYSSEFAGFEEKDIDGDGIPELLLGDQFEDGGYMLYDLYTIDPEDGSLIHLACGGERDTFVINGDGTIIERGSNSAFDSFEKGFKLEGGELVELKDDTGWNDSLLIVNLEKFSTLARPKNLVGAFGDQREPTGEEMEMFRNATEGDPTVYTPLSVSTQVVAGTNYRFWCRYQDVSPVNQGEEQSYGHCWITIFKPLPGRGEPIVSSIEKEQEQ